MQENSSREPHDLEAAAGSPARDRENPFAPPTTDFSQQKNLPPAGADDKLPLETLAPPRSVAGSIGVWTLVCTLSAAPSFFWGWNSIATNQAAAMLTGILIFIAGYVWADQATQKSTWRKNPDVRLTLKIGYITRMAISIVFPIGSAADLACGLLSMLLLQATNALEPASIGTKESTDFGTTLLLTLTQGVLLNIVLFAFMLIVLSVVATTNRLRKSN